MILTIANPDSPIAKNKRAQAVRSVEVEVNSPRSNNTWMMGLRSNTSPTDAGSVTNRTMRIAKFKVVFNSSIRRVAEEDIASESVKQAIRKIILAEDKSNPYSDQAIVKILEDTDGIKIARRTVAKYREMLNILSSSKRKKMF